MRITSKPIQKGRGAKIKKSRIATKDKLLPRVARKPLKIK